MQFGGAGLFFVGQENERDVGPGVTPMVRPFVSSLRVVPE
jgi:hypothetical protein